MTDIAKNEDTEKKKRGDRIHAHRLKSAGLLGK
jgi:hypothetical protein